MTPKKLIKEESIFYTAVEKNDKINSFSNQNHTI